MRLVIILSLLCVSLLSHPLRLAAREGAPDSGQGGKPRWLLSNTKLKAEGISNEGRKAL